MRLCMGRQRGTLNQWKQGRVIDKEKQHRLLCGLEVKEEQKRKALNPRGFSLGLPTTRYA
jgi:hypothetical protein